MKNWLFILFLVTLLGSCTFLTPEKVDEDALFEEEIKTLYTSEVDVYPSFETCPTNETTSENKECLQKVLTTYLVNQLQAHPKELSSFYQHELYFHFTVHSNAKFVMDSVTSSANASTDFVSLVAKLNMSELPNLIPAQKRGIPVTSSFYVPIVVK